MNNIVIVDDHPLVASAIRGMVDNFPKCSILFEVRNGQELLNRIAKPKNIPDLILLDISMPILNGFETMKILHKEYPDIKVLGLSMNDDEETFLKLLELGANGFISKTAEESELHNAINEVLKKGYYYSENVTQALFHSMQSKKEPAIFLSEREKELLSYICTEMTYQEIASQMFLSPKTVDGYRNSLFRKLDIKSRVGLAMYAVKNGYFSIDE